MNTIHDILQDNKNIITEDAVIMLNEIQKFYENESINGEFFLNYCVYHVRGFGGNWDYGNAYFKNYVIKTIGNKNVSTEDLGKLWGKYCDQLSNIINVFITKLS